MLRGGACSRSFRPALTLRSGVFHQAPIGFLTIDRLHPSRFKIVITTVEQFPSVGQLVKKTVYPDLKELIAAASGILSHLLRFRLHVGGEMSSHHLKRRRSKAGLSD